MVADRQHASDEEHRRSSPPSKRATPTTPRRHGHHLQAVGVALDSILNK